MRSFFSYIGIICGSLLFAFGLNYFIIANGLAEGGLTGVALITHYLTGWPAGIILGILNIPVMLLGWYKWGFHFVFKTIICVILISASLDLLQGAQLGLAASDLLLAALYGGVITGIGTGIVLRSGATTGGMDVVARFLYEKYGFKMGTVYFSFDIGVLTIVALIFGLEKALYTLVALFVYSQVVDRIIEGFNEARAVIIVSQESIAINQAILKEIQRGATLIKGSGAYTGQEKDVIYVVIGKGQLLQLKRLVRELDPQAFVTVNHVYEVMGEGFSKAF
ncbi:MAG: YitT family protein [Desulfocucumaceae bacterium]